MSEVLLDTGQSQLEVAVGRRSGRARMPARKLLEERVTNRQLQQMMHAMDTSSASSGISAEVSAVNGLIVALSQQIVQLTSELKATKDELMAAKNELIATKNEMTTKKELGTLKAELTAMIQTQLSNIVVPASASPSYAAIARTPPKSQPSNLPSFSSRSLTLSTMTDILYYTIDTTRVKEEDKNRAQPGIIREAIEKEMRSVADKENWRYTAVTRDPRNVARIRVTCRDETELQLVKEATHNVAASGVRILRDQLYPVKVDNANRAAVLEQNSSVRAGVVEALEKENDMRIAKMA